MISYSSCFLFLSISLAIIGCSGESGVTQEPSLNKIDYYFSNAIEQSNERFCDRLDSNKHSCYQYVAIAENNVSLCQSISNQTLRDECYLGISYNVWDFNLCYNHSTSSFFIGFYQDPIALCNVLLPTNNPNIERCSQAPSGIRGINREDWSDFCYFTIGQKYLNVSVCLNIQNPIRKSYCVNSLRNIKIDPKLCYDNNDNNGINFCILDAAVLTRTPQFCKEISSSNLQGVCYLDLAIVTNNRDICYMIEGTKKYGCLARVIGKR